MSQISAKSWIFRIVLLAASVLLTLLAFEIGFRIQSWVHDKRLDAAIDGIRNAETVQKGAKVGLAQSIRFSTNSKIVYELIPNLSVQFRGTGLRTDSNGFRIPPHGAVVKQDAVRLLGIGDSFMFGWDVEAEECYLSLLSQRLNSRDGEIPWQITNLAVPGYNTVMQVEAFKEKGLPLKPDIVLVHFVINDMDMPNFIVERASIFSLRRSFLRERFRKNFRNMARGTDRLIRLPSDPEDHRGAIEETVPASYRDMVGPEPYLDAMRELHTLSLEHSFRVVVLCDLTAPAIVRRICRELFLLLVETADEVELHLEESGQGEYVDSDLILGSTDTHPSVTGHRLIADVLAETFQRFPRKQTGGNTEGSRAGMNPANSESSTNLVRKPPL